MSIHTGLPTKDETVKTTKNSLNATIPRFKQVFCLRYSYLMAYLKICTMHMAKKETSLQLQGIVNLRTVDIS